MKRDYSLTGLRLVLSNSNDNIDGFLRFSTQVVINDLLDTSGISDLGVESCTGIVGYHPVTSAQGVLHGPPGVIRGSGLHIPDIPGVTVELTTLECPGYRALIADRTASSVY